MLFNKNIPKEARNRSIEAFLSARDEELDDNENDSEEHIDKTKQT